MCLRSGDPHVWDGVLFVRKGPYAPAVLRFRIDFPTSFPLRPPLISFYSDPFHPLLTPLSTASFTSILLDDGNPEERLPPGAFSLRNAFPSWFQGSLNPTWTAPASMKQLNKNSQANSKPDSDRVNGVSVVDILRYLRSAFEDESVMDALPFEAVANQGAWYAWRAYRAKQGVDFGAQAPEHKSRPRSPTNREETAPRSRHPSEWNWEGVWTQRVRKAVQNSLTDASLYGQDGPREDEVPWKFSKVEWDTIEENLKDIRQHLSISE